MGSNNNMINNNEFQEDEENMPRRRESFSQFIHRDEFPGKAAILSIFLTIMGGCFFVAGFMHRIKEWDPFHGWLFWGAGIVLLLPGVFYLVKIIQAYRAKDEGDKQELLNEIPEL